MTLPKLIMGGGTLIQPAFDLIINDKYLKENDTYIYTDGYTEKASFIGYHKNIYQIKPHGNYQILDILISDQSKFKLIK
jgi:predicted metal-dependent peptidase